MLQFVEDKVVQSLFPFTVEKRHSSKTRDQDKTYFFSKLKVPSSEVKEFLYKPRIKQYKAATK